MENNDIVHLDKFLVPIEVGKVICHGGESGPSVGVVTRLTEHKIEIKRLCAVEERIDSASWKRENYKVTGYYWGKTMINAPERCIVLPINETALVIDFLLSHRIGEKANPACKLAQEVLNIESV